MIITIIWNIVFLGTVLGIPITAFVMSSYDDRLRRQDAIRMDKVCELKRKMKLEKEETGLV